MIYCIHISYDADFKKQYKIIILLRFLNIVRFFYLIVKFFTVILPCAKELREVPPLTPLGLGVTQALRAGCFLLS